MRCSKMFKYTSNQNLKTEFKKILIDNNLTLTDVASQLKIVPQQLNNKFNNKRIAFTDIQEFLNVVGYDLYIDFKPRPEKIIE